jgi:molybdopterin synthase sulfur carrier subunit
MTRILFFGRLRDVAGQAEMICDPPREAASVAALRDWLAARDPLLGEALAGAGVRVAVNQQFCSLDTSLADAEEIAFMSPLSGG